MDVGDTVQVKWPPNHWVCPHCDHQNGPGPGSPRDGNCSMRHMSDGTTQLECLRCGLRLMTEMRHGFLPAARWTVIVMPDVWVNRLELLFDAG